MFKWACFRDVEASGFQCSPTQLQVALAIDRSEFHKQDQQGFFTNVNETITVKKIRRRIRQQALNHQVRFQLDARFSFFQDFHPTQLSFNDPPFILVLPLVNTIPGTSFIYSPSSPSTKTEQSLHNNDTNGASVAAPWKPPSPT
ncbi:hypothetical protein SLA2020_389360 [Shorea laevis]